VAVLRERMSEAKELPYGVVSGVGRRKGVLVGVQIATGQGAVLGDLMATGYYKVFNVFVVEKHIRFV